MSQDCFVRDCEYSGTGKGVSMTYVGIIQRWGQNPNKQNKPDERMHLSPPGYQKRTAHPRDLCPIKREEGHSQPRMHAEQLVDDDIVWGCPAYEGKD